MRFASFQRAPVVACIVLGGAFAVAALRADPAPVGWSRIDLPAASGHALLYVPAALNRARPAPLVVFLHGYGTNPEAWQSTLSGPADAAGVVVLAPRSQGLGWGEPGDEELLRAALLEAGNRVLIDPRRTSIAGHSAGGAYAYLVGYGTLLNQLPRFSGVFILSSPYYSVTQLADPAYVAPLRMHYGDQDPNYQNGARAALRQQWQRLGVPFEEEVDAGYGHSTWPADTLPDGFAFLARQTYPGFSATCSPSGSSLCLHDGRYRVEIAWHTANDAGTGHAVPLAAADSGLFWFFNAGNIELLVKVLDGCAVNGRVWVFASATTNVGFTLTVTDTIGGAVKRYENALGHPASIVTDTSAFATCP